MDVEKIKKEEREVKDRGKMATKNDGKLVKKFQGNFWKFFENWRKKFGKFGIGVGVFFVAVLFWFV